MAIPVVTNFKVMTNKPIDERSVVDSIDERNAIDETLRYEGMKVFVVANGTTYVLKGGTSDDYWAAEGTSEAAQVFKCVLADAEELTSTLLAGGWKAGWQWLFGYATEGSWNIGDTLVAIADAPDSVDSGIFSDFDTYFAVMSTSSVFSALLTRIEALEKQLNGITFDVDDDGNLTATKED